VQVGGSHPAGAGVAGGAVFFGGALLGGQG
jgi:hypothetical protein